MLAAILVAVIATVIAISWVAVMMVASFFILLIFIALSVLFLVTCLIPCSAPMESSDPPPDGSWIVTLGDPEPPAHVSMNNVVKVLPDGMLACQSTVDVIGRATTTIHIMQLEFDSNPDFILTFLQSGPQPPMRQRLTLQQALFKAIDEHIDIKIRILLNVELIDSVNKLKKEIGVNNNIIVEGIDVSPFGPFGIMHAKALIVDGATAFVDGLPFAQGYWDTQLHFVKDARRGAGAGGDFPPLGSVGNGVGNKPAHTVSLRLDGPAAADVDASFISLWNSVAATSGQIPAPPVPVEGLGRQTVQIVRTAPKLKKSIGFSDEKGVLEGYLRAIKNARSFIYIEVQYLTTPVIGKALLNALQMHPALELILLINENPDMPTYKFWQNQLLDTLTEFGAERVGVFSLWRTTAPAPGQQMEIMQCYLEAKVMVVDDVWASVGSGNMDGPSTGHMFEFMPSPFSCFSANNGYRNVELNALLFDGIAGQPATGEVRTLRDILWTEHLGLDVIPVDMPGGGLVNLWSEVAKANIKSLNTSQAMTGSNESPSRILPYSPSMDTTGQLNDIGVNTSLFNVAPAVPS